MDILESKVLEWMIKNIKKMDVFLTTYSRQFNNLPKKNWIFLIKKSKFLITKKIFVDFFWGNNWLFRKNQLNPNGSYGSKRKLNISNHNI